MKKVIFAIVTVTVFACSSSTSNTTGNDCACSDSTNCKDSVCLDSIGIKEVIQMDSLYKEGRL